MKYFFCYTTVALLLVFALLPVMVIAQTVGDISSTAQYDASGTTPSQQRMIHDWRQSSELQQKITALGAIPVAAIPMPVLFGVALSDISPNFGDIRDGGARTHEGEDIMAVKGTPVVSPTAAVVLRTDFFSGGGNTIYTANPGGETFVYMHLDRFGEGIVSGKILQEGSLIGYVGNTGNAAGGPAHLHFEVHNSAGVPTDPFPRLTVEFTPEQKISFLTIILTQTSDPAFTDAITGIDRNLTVGMTGNDVKILQAWLNTHGYVLALSGPGSLGNETTTFGGLTRAALAKFQSDVGISPAVGYFGPITRSYLSIHY